MHISDDEFLEAPCIVSGKRKARHNELEHNTPGSACHEPRGVVFGYSTHEQRGILKSRQLAKSKPQKSLALMRTHFSATYMACVGLASLSKLP